MSVRLYRLLLLLLPRDFRREYGDLMVDAFRFMLRDRSSTLPAVWFGAVVDLMKTANREWRDEMRSLSTYRALLIVIVATALLLLVPAFAMRFTDQVTWSPFDFVIAGILLSGTGFVFVLVAVVLLSGTGFAYGMVVGPASRVAYRLAVALALGSALFLVWVILAVGVIGDSGERPDLMYLAVLAVGVAGAAVARLEPRGMARTLLAMATTQAIIAAVALLGDMVPAYNTAYEIVGVNALFVALFLAAAGLFRAAARPDALALAVPRA